MLSREQIQGKKVVRGPAWKYGDQDENSVGVVVGLDSVDGWINVKWGNGRTYDYRWGAQNCYDVQLHE